MPSAAAGASTTLPGQLGTYYYRNIDIAATAIAVRASSTVIYALTIDNTNNTIPVYLKLWNSAGPTVGTTAPDGGIFRALAGEKLSVTFPRGITCGTALSAACVTTGGTGGTTSPPHDVIVEILCT